MVIKWFIPEPDITAYDLWLVLSNLTDFTDTGGVNPVTFPKDIWEILTPTLKRHFKDAPSETNQ